MSRPRSPRGYTLASPGAGAYRVQLIGEDPRHVASATFAGPADRQRVALPPGRYTAYIEPLGGAAKIVQSVRLAAQTGPIWLKDDLSALPSTPSTAAQRRSRTAATDGAQAPRAFEIGLSVDRHTDRFGGWEAGRPRLSISEPADGGMAMLLWRPADWEAFPRWRLTIAVENDPLWRVPLPLFRGGLQLLLRPVETPAGPDFSVTLAPRRPHVAALVAEMHSAFAPDVHQAVAAGLGAGGDKRLDLSDLLTRLDDPWALTAAALILTRTGDVDLAVPCVAELERAYPWLPDVLVLGAWRRAVVGGDEAEVERACLTAIQTSRARGAPYFTPTDTLAHELLSALALSAGAAEVKAAAGEEQAIWLLRSRRRMRTEPYLSWEDAGADASSWPLPAKGYETLASGLIGTGGVERLRRPPVKTAAAPTDGPPGLRRPIQRPDDPQWGRWGRRRARRGYALSAVFARGPEGWVQVTLVVTAPPGAKAGQVDLFLHDTFEPDHVVATFEDGVAEHVVLAYGGFTVGAWIGAERIQLELDLSKVKGAPQVIREL